MNNSRQYKCFSAPFRNLAEGVRMIYNTQLAVLLLAVVVISAFRNDWNAIIFLPAMMASFFTEKAAGCIIRRTPNGSTSHSLVLVLVVCLLLPSNIGWQYLVGLAFMTIILKHLQGGLGCYLFNPALAVVFLFELTYKNIIVAACPGLSGTDKALTMNSHVLSGMVPADNNYWFVDTFVNKFENVRLMITGQFDSPLAMVPIVFCMAGLYFIYRGYLNWRVPAVYLASLVIALLILPISTEQGPFSLLRCFPGIEEVITFLIYHIFSGFIIFAAAILFIDYSCRPLTVTGQMLAAFTAGTLTVVSRNYLPFLYPAVAAVLFTGMLTPLFDVITRKKPNRI